jgi:hypothetical protein
MGLSSDPEKRQIQLGNLRKGREAKAARKSAREKQAKAKRTPTLRAPEKPTRTRSASSPRKARRSPSAAPKSSGGSGRRRGFFSGLLGNLTPDDD